MTSKTTPSLNSTQKTRHDKTANTAGPRYAGFTIVELLIVVVVIAILAAITLVAYDGITSRANDAARQSDAESISTALELRYAELNKYGLGYGEDYPETRDEYLGLFNLSTLSSRLVVCRYDDCLYSSDPSQYDKTKVYFSGGDDYVNFSYWSNADGKWKNHYYWAYSADETGSVEDESDTPFFWESSQDL